MYLRKEKDKGRTSQGVERIKEGEKREREKENVGNQEKKEVKSMFKRRIEIGRTLRTDTKQFNGK